MKKLPPVEKVYEAWTALATPGRVTLENNGSASVASSDGAKTYTVTISDDNTASSNDNATYWRGYAGYPVIAVLMLQGRLPLDSGMASQFAGIDWKTANTAVRGQYAVAALDLMQQRGIDSGAALKAASAVIDALAALPLKIVRPGKNRIRQAEISA